MPKSFFERFLGGKDPTPDKGSGSGPDRATPRPEAPHEASEHAEEKPDIIPSLQPHETLVTDDRLKRESIGSVRIGHDNTTAYELPYGAVPPELRISLHPTEVHTTATETRKVPNVYRLRAHETDSLGGKTDNVYVEVGGFIRLKRTAERPANRPEEIMDVHHDANGFPVESTRKIDGKIRRVIRNVFDGEGRPASQQRTDIKEDGREVIESIQYAYQPMEGGGGATHTLRGRDHENARWEGVA